MNNTTTDSSDMNEFNNAAVFNWGFPITIGEMSERLLQAVVSYFNVEQWRLLSVRVEDNGNVLIDLEEYSKGVGYCKKAMTIPADGLMIARTNEEAGEFLNVWTIVEA